MKHRTIGLTAALFAALIGTAFLFTACWQGNRAGGSDMPGGGGAITPGGTNPGNTNPGNTSAPDIEGITWKTEGLIYISTLKLEEGNARFDQKPKPGLGGPYSYSSTDYGSYTINGNTIKFTGFTSVARDYGLNNINFKYKVEGDTLTLSKKSGTDSYRFTKE